MSLRVMTLVFSSLKLVLSDILFVPFIRGNLLSISALIYHGYSIAFGTM